MGMREAFAKNLKKYRIARGLTKQDLAHKLDVHWNTVNRWEKGELFPKTDMIEKIAKVLKVDLHELLKPPEPEPFPGFHDVMALPVRERYFKVFELAANHCGFEGAIVHALGDPVFKDEVPMLETEEDVVKAYNEYKAFWEERAKKLLELPGIDEERRKAAKRYLEKKFGVKIKLEEK